MKVHGVFLRFPAMSADHSEIFHPPQLQLNFHLIFNLIITQLQSVKRRDATFDRALMVYHLLLVPSLHSYGQLCIGCSLLKGNKTYETSTAMWPGHMRNPRTWLSFAKAYILPLRI